MLDGRRSACWRRRGPAGRAMSPTPGLMVARRTRPLASHQLGSPAATFQSPTSAAGRPRTTARSRPDFAYASRRFRGSQCGPCLRRRRRPSPRARCRVRARWSAGDLTSGSRQRDGRRRLRGRSLTSHSARRIGPSGRHERNCPTVPVSRSSLTSPLRLGDPYRGSIGLVRSRDGWRQMRSSNEEGRFRVGSGYRRPERVRRRDESSHLAGRLRRPCRQR
jgi:hypothetical protein